jgi:hypothetical protein
MRFRSIDDYLTTLNVLVDELGSSSDCARADGWC